MTTLSPPPKHDISSADRLLIQTNRMVFLFRPGTVYDKLRLILRATRQHACNLALYAGLYKLVVYLLPIARANPTISPFSPDDDHDDDDYIQKKYSSAGLVDRRRRREGRHDPFVAGLLAGYVVFGRGQQSSVNQQITIYVFARVLLAVAKLLAASFLQSLGRPSRRGPMDEGNHAAAAAGATAGRGAIGASSSTIMRFIRQPPNAWPLFASLSWASVMFLFRWYPDTLQPSLRSSMRYM